MANDLNIGGNTSAQLNIIQEMMNARDAALQKVTEAYATPVDLVHGEIPDGFFLDPKTAQMFGGSESARLGCTCPTEPSPSDSAHPAGSLQVTEQGVITTPGGYKIEATKQHEWTVTGPDGKTTRVWGDPHVEEGDGGKWDFKRDSTFVLPDGTRINVSTTPWRDGRMTVTSGLEVISGNDRVNVTGIDQGKGKVGELTQDGYARTNAFGGKDVFVMGKETDDWSHQGKEVVGSENGGESFKLGDALEAGVWKPEGNKPADPTRDSLAKLFEGLSKVFEGLKDLFGSGNEPGSYNPYYGPHGGCWGQRDDAAQYQRGLGEAFRAMGRMFELVGRMNDLRTTVRPAPVRY